MAIEYNFKYMPLVGKLSGQSMVQQTETAINEIAKIVNDNTAQAEIINTLAEEANANSVEALEKANESIETSSRYYVNETAAVNLDDYCEAQLIYINNAFSQNLPVAHKGFLEVKTNSDKTQATQVFADNVDRKFYVRTGEITATEIGDVTTYTASYGDWANIPNSTDLANYLPVAGGTMNGDIEYSISDFAIKSNDINNNGQISVVGATDNLNGASLNLYGRNHTEVGAFELNANNGTLTKTLKGDASGNLTWDNNDLALAKDFLSLSGGTMTGNITFNMADCRIKKSDNNGAMSLYGGTDWETSPSLALYGSGYTNAGSFDLSAHDGTTRKQLIGKPDGTLTWNGSNVLTAAGGELNKNAVIRGIGAFLANKVNTSFTQINGGIASADGATINLFGKDESTRKGYFYINASNGSTAKRIDGRPDGTLLWNGQPIQTSSDKRLKTDFSDVPADVLEAWSKVEWKQFKYIADVKQKGDSCRFHTGLVAQDVRDACGDEILKYGILCHDVQEATEEQEAVDLWTVRYTEALCMEVIYLRNEIKKLHEEIKELRTE